MAAILPQPPPRVSRPPQSEADKQRRLAKAQAKRARQSAKWRKIARKDGGLRDDADT